ncbi:MAG: hypothetical protein WEA58_05585 [Balneolaceae bacterium]
MASFLRDEQVENLTISEERIIQFDQAFLTRSLTVPERVEDPNDTLVYYYNVIRFDNKGYRVFSIDELKSYFNQADQVERVIFTIESKDSLNSNRATGSYMELRLDASNSSNCYLVVSSEDADWVDASFSNVKEILDKCKNKHGLARGAWSELSIQLSGVLIGFLISLWAAVSMTPFLEVDNAFFIIFLFALLIYSNLWTYINETIHSFVRRIFPPIKFYRTNRDKLHWILQAIVGGTFAAIILLFLKLIFNAVGYFLNQYLNIGA